MTNRHPATGKPATARPDPALEGRDSAGLLTGIDPRMSRLASRCSVPGDTTRSTSLWVSADRALVAEVDDSGPVRVIELHPGPHVLTTGDLDDLALPKVAMLRTGMDSALAAGGGSGATLLRMRAFLANHISPTARSSTPRASTAMCTARSRRRA